MAQQEEAKRSPMLFNPFQSTLDAGFWHELGRRKLEKYRLSSDPVPITGTYTNSCLPDLPMALSLDYGAFEEEPTASSAWICTSPGELRNTNTMDAFKTCDKKQLLNEAGEKVWQAIVSGEAISKPSQLTQFLLLTYADLKKYNYAYWFAFPAIVADSPPITYEKVSKLSTSHTADQRTKLASAFDSFKQAHPNDAYFLIDIKNDSFSFKPLSSFDEVYKDGKLTVGFSDPSTLELHPGWPLRNFFFLLSQQWGDKLKEVDILCYRDYTREGQRHIEHSLFFEGVSLPQKVADTSKVPKIVGWEKNEKGKLSPRLVNLSSNMDPARLAESATDLNLKLMRWRLLPSLDLDTIRKTRCLLLGAGTLGCNVARCLMGWGVRSITLVDNSRVSYSNPVRQSLFKFSDCPNGGAKKAEAAAKSLKEIFPGMESEWVELTIPMPGHSVGSEPGAVDKVKADVKKLEELIVSHDAVFLLMDTRESRWLPTLLCAHYSKLCINAALGFDTYMIMRHGFLPPADAQLPSMPPGKRIPGNKLGCYYCNDVVAPTDSTRDRTLDQQCTVSRPGLSMIAAALAVELLVSVLQHPNAGLAAADSHDNQDDADTECGLGIVPHQIRGFLSRFQNVVPASERFDMCTACSDVVLTCYRKEGFEFFLRAFNTPNYLEELTGLSKLYAETLDDHIWELSDDDEF